MDPTIFSPSAYECAVCHTALDRVRIHYGGLSCYSCRAFFRRMCQRGNIAECKEKKNCKVSYIDRVSCPPCRYQKCISVGMKPKLILNENEKKTDLKKPPLKTANTKSKTDQNKGKRISAVLLNFKNEKRSRQIKCENTQENHEDNEEEDDDDDKEEKEELTSEFFPPKECEYITSCVSEEEYNEESTLDPETGLILDPHTKTPTSAYRPITSSGPDTFEMVTVAAAASTAIQSTSLYTNKHTLGNASPNTSSQKIDIEYVVFHSKNEEDTQAERRHSVIDQNPSGTQEVEKAYNEECDTEENEDIEDLIVQYVHKKFNRQDNIKKDRDCGFSIKKVLIYPQSRKNYGSYTQASTSNTRQSVIVSRQETSNVVQIELMDNLSMNLSKAYQDTDMVLSLTVKEIENIYTIEESQYVENMISNFYHGWKSVNLGVQNVSRFIKFCQNPGPLYEGYYLFKSRIFRKRILCCVANTEEFQCLPATTRYNLLKNNLRAAELLIKIFWFNCPSPTEEKDLVQGVGDTIQWQASNTKDLKLLNARQVLELVPFSPSIKSTLLDLIMSVSNPILGDWSVIVHMTMLFIFGAHNYDTADLTVQNINKQLWTMLRRHLTNTMSCQASVNSSMAHIHHCLQTLPTMLEVHKDVLNKFV